MFEQLAQYSDLGLFLTRLAVGIIFLVHGWPKMKNAKQMASGIGWPYQAMWVQGLVEILSALGVILGAYMQLSAFLMAIIMVGAIYFKIFKWKIPFMTHSSTGWEFDLILLAANLTILLTGGGAMKIF